MAYIRATLGMLLLFFFGMFVIFSVIAPPEGRLATQLAILWVAVANTVFAYILMRGSSPYVLLISMILGLLPFVYLVPAEVFFEKTWGYLLWFVIQGTLAIVFRNQLAVR